MNVTAFAGYRLAINTGYTFGPAVAGYLAHRSFFYLFLGEALTSVMFGVVALTALPEGTHSLGTRLYDRSPEALWLVCGLLGIVSGGMILGSRRLGARPELARPGTSPEVPGTPP